MSFAFSSIVNKQLPHQLCLWEMKTQGCLILFSYLVFGVNCQLKLAQYDQRMEAQALKSICVLIYYILSDSKKKS